MAGTQDGLQLKSGSTHLHVHSSLPLNSLGSRGHVRNTTQVILQPEPQTCLIDNPSLVDSRLYQGVTSWGRGLQTDLRFFPGTTGCGGAGQEQQRLKVILS